MLLKFKFMKRICDLILLFSLLFFNYMVFADVPHMINYQGKINVYGVPFNGTGNFKFVIKNSAGNYTYWSNDNSNERSGVSEPSTSTQTYVTNGVFNIVLGQPTGSNMVAISSTVFEHTDTYLEVWFSSGTDTPQHLLPDQPLISVGYAFKSENTDKLCAQTTDYYFNTSVSTQTKDGSANFAVSSGRVGIGTNSPQGKFDVSGGVSIGSYAGSNIPPGNGLIVSSNVGIGTSTPDRRLDVNGGAVIRSSLTVISASTTESAIFIASHSVGGIGLYVSTDAKVGIGTQDLDNRKLSVSNGSNISIIRTEGEGDQYTYSALELAKNSSPYEQWSIGIRKDYFGSANPLRLDFVNYDGTSWSERVAISSDGVLGIGGFNTDHSNKLAVFGNAYISGSLYLGGVKSFVTSYSIDPKKDVVFVCLEGPEAGTYIRGTAKLENGTSIINLPDYYSSVTNKEGITVQLTPLGQCNGLYVEKKNNEEITVKELSDGKSNVEFDYFICGIRKGYEDFKVIRDKTTFERFDTPRIK